MPWAVFQRGRELPLIRFQSRDAARAWVYRAADKWAATMKVKRVPPLVRPWPPKG